MEVRAGTGGDEAAIFAGDLFRMYSRFSEDKGWRLEVLNASEAEQGGYKEIVARLSGDNVYGTGGSGTSIVLDSVTGFPTTGTNYIQVGTEEISYTGVSGTTTLTGITRAVRGTTRAAHLSHQLSRR